MAGALAARRYRDSDRFTTDLDLLVTWHPDLIERFEGHGFDVRAHADRGSHPHLLMLRSPSQKVDLIVAVVEYQELALRRGLAEHVLTVEDVLVHKLLAWRPKDRLDIQSILRSGTAYDDDYVTDWAGQWDVADRWAKAKAGDFSD